ncbi:chromate transporter [Peptostreptococcus faecalis]|uniref:chromate transporter n=1 Tax=Peptostreptococcus faecalis TaxID=2045015 RepID=UPI000C7CE56E|nr:chromate transporter [Peptostreptococcus faecalis]
MIFNNLLTLAMTFLKIGAFSFGGGYAVLPLIQKYVIKENAWLTIKELTDLVSLSQITPGPIGVNAATFIGMKTNGLTGAVIASFAAVIPGCIIMFILAKIIFNGKKIKAIDYILKGLKPAVASLILIAAIEMFKTSLISSNSIKPIALIGFIVGFLLFSYRKYGVIKIIGITFAMGILVNIFI